MLVSKRFSYNDSEAQLCGVLSPRSFLKAAVMRGVGKWSRCIVSCGRSVRLGGTDRLLEW